MNGYKLLTSLESQHIMVQGLFLVRQCTRVDTMGPGKTFVERGIGEGISYL